MIVQFESKYLSSLRRRIEDQDGDKRRDIAVAVAALFRREGWRRSAQLLPLEDLARVLARDANPSIREALAQGLKDCAGVPLDVARGLAVDETRIAVPFIRASMALDDDFLARLVVDCSEAKRVAVAARRRLSETLALAIVEHGSVPSVGRLIENRGASLSRHVGQTVCERFSWNPVLRLELSKRLDIGDLCASCRRLSQNSNKIRCIVHKLDRLSA